MHLGSLGRCEQLSLLVRPSSSGAPVMTTGLKGQAGAIALLLAGLSGAVVIPLTGLWSDRAGRVPIYRFYAMYQLLIAFPSWWVLRQGNQALSIAAVCIALVGVWGMFATQGAFLPELFGARHRYIGVAVGRRCRRSSRAALHQ